MIRTTSTLNLADLDTIIKVIETILSPDTQAREQSEALLKSTSDKDFNGYIHAFANILKSTEKLPIKVFCIAHLRRLFSLSLDNETDNDWANLTLHTQKLLKDTTLEMLRDDKDYSYRKILCDLVSDLASAIQNVDINDKKKISKESTEWNELKRALTDMLKSGNAVLALNATVVVNNVLEFDGEFLSNNILQVFESLKAIIKSELESDLKQKALDTITNIIEIFPDKFSKNADIIKDLAKAIFNYMISIDEEPDADWINPPEGAFETSNGDDNPSESRIRVCMATIDSIVDALPKKGLPIFSQQIYEMIKVDDWRYKHSALMGLSQITEYMHDMQEFDLIVQFIINSLSHEHPKVRYASLHCLGQISDYHLFEFQKKYGETILPILIKMYSDNMPRVINHAMNATINFIEGSSSKQASKYLQQILEPALHFVEKGRSMLKESAIGVIASIAITCGQTFVPYWEKACEVIFNVILESSSDLAALKGQAIEALSKIASAVGRTEFNKISSRLIEEMVKIQAKEAQAEKPGAICSYLMGSWSILCLAMKEDIVQYQDLILESGLKLAQNVIKEEKAKTKKALGDEDEVNIVNKLIGKIDNQEKLPIKNNTAYNSETVFVAIKMLEGFFKYGVQPEHLSCIEPTLRIIGDFLLEENDSDDEDDVKNIRLLKKEAGQSFVSVITALEKSNIIAKKQETFLMIHHYWLLRFSKPIVEEEDPAILKIYITVLTELIRKTGKCMKDKELEQLTAIMLKVFRLSYERGPPFLKDVKDDEENEEENEGDEDEESKPKNLEEDLRCAVADLFGALFEVYKKKTMPLVNVISKELIPENRGMWKDAICTIDKVGLRLISNIIEHFGIDLIPEELFRFTKILAAYVIGDDLKLRRAAAYGIGVLSKASKETFKKISKECMEALYEAVELKREDNDDIMREFYLAKDDIVIALGKIIKLQQDNIDLKKAVGLWVEYLPLWYDTIQSRDQHNQLVDMLIEQDVMQVIGEKGENMETIVELLAKVVDSKHAARDFKQKLNEVIRLFSGKEPTRSWLQAAVRKLKPNMKNKLKAAMDEDSEALQFITGCI